MTPDLNIVPDIKISTKQVFGIESNIEVEKSAPPPPQYIPPTEPQACDVGSS